MGLCYVFCVFFIIVIFVGVLKIKKKKMRKVWFNQN